MFIQTEDTPNPKAMKFLPGQPVLSAGGTMDFRDAASANALSPLAASLFSLGGVSGVLLGADFVTVTQDGSADWRALRAEVLALLMDHFTRGAEVVRSGASAKDIPTRAGEEESGEETPITRQIKELLDARVRPAVAQDGGDITFVRFTDGVVYLKMQGACSGCPSSSATLKMGIENMMKHYIPEVTEVRAV